ncbi:hypothetical protein [Nostoc sp.]|uniref:hypothetical protein n=1 Tax=Nostoc sp. TaxID=1180 RepID=UPI002FFA4534
MAFVFRMPMIDVVRCATRQHTLPILEYSRKFVEEVIGSWEGEPLERPEQLPIEEREEIQWSIS